MLNLSRTTKRPPAYHGLRNTALIDKNILNKHLADKKKTDGPQAADWTKVQQVITTECALQNLYKDLG